MRQGFLGYAEQTLHEIAVQRTVKQNNAMPVMPKRALSFGSLQVGNSRMRCLFIFQIPRGFCSPSELSQAAVITQSISII
jgi:hypothetical protein